MKTLYCSSLLLGLADLSSAFTTTTGTIPRHLATALLALDTSDIDDFGYYVSVQKPIGVVFGENKEPYRGLRVDEVAPGTEGGRVGLRVGDQLLAVDGRVVIGDSFDGCMDALKRAPSQCRLLLFRGTVRDLYTILNNRGLEVGRDDDDGAEEIVMDENYESPVRVEVVESRGFDLGLAMSRLLGGGKKETTDAYPEVESAANKEAPPPPKSKSGGGLFGMFGESIQLEGEEAKGMK